MQVKPLAWRIFCSRSGNRMAETPFGNYVLQFENGQWVLYYPHSDDKAWAFDDLEPALAMAQEDVTQRIKKMVVEPGVKPLTKAELAEALDAFWNAALHEARNSFDTTTNSIAAAMVSGVHAISTRLKELDNA